MKKPFVILVAESKDQSFADLSNTLENIERKLEIRIELEQCTSLSSLEPLLPSADAVMSNLLLLDYPGGTEGINGQIIAKHCLERVKPVILYSLPSNDLEMYDGTCVWALDRGIALFEVYAEHNGSKKNQFTWLQVLAAVVALLEGLRMGTYAIESSKMFATIGNHDPEFVLLGNRLNDLVRSLAIPDDNPVKTKLLQLGFGRFPECKHS
jgi:hypothetical protein